MTDQFVDANKMVPITPPPELVEQWIEQGVSRPSSTDYMMWFATQAARWGADMELEACCEWLCVVDRWKTVVDRMRAARRPKLPSLKEQALEAFDFIGKCHPITGSDWATIRRALESLPS